MTRVRSATQARRPLALLLLALPLAGLLAGCAQAPRPGAAAPTVPALTDHFDGKRYFNPGELGTTPSAPEPPQRRRRSWVWRWLLGDGWPAWPEVVDTPVGPRPVERVGRGHTRVTLVNHATFLIQMDGVNLLTDPIWSERCGPVSWLGPKRHRPAGLRFEDLPPIDAVLVSHNHYDHLDRPTLERLAAKFGPRALTPLGNGELLLGAGLASAQELDWWQSVPLSAEVTVTLVPAQHFSSRTLWDRNEALWGGFVISGPAGNVFFAGDTGYGPHFQEIARRFSPISVAILPISPFRRPRPSSPEASSHPARVHLGPAEAVQAHLDLGARRSLASHFQTFQLGEDEFAEAPTALAAAVQRRGLEPGAFVALAFGQGVDGLQETSRGAGVETDTGTAATPAFGHPAAPGRVTEGRPRSGTSP